MKRLAFGILSVVFLISCQPKSALQSFSGRSESGIIHGRDLTAGEPLSQSVVAIWDVKAHAMCTGSLLPGNLVVTAAHCLDVRPSQLLIVFSNQPFDVLDSRELDVIAESTRRVVAYEVNPDYHQAIKEDRPQDQSDIGLLRFEGTLPEGYAPAKMLAEESDLKVGADVTLAGYGVSIVKTIPYDIKGETQNELDEMIQMGQIICDDDYKKCLEIEMDGDGILRAAHAPIADITDSEVVLDETQQGTCSGDSGGPAYIEKDGFYYLFGVTSRGGALCDDDGVYTNILAHKEWLQKAANKLHP